MSAASACRRARRAGASLLRLTASARPVGSAARARLGCDDGPGLPAADRRRRLRADQGTKETEVYEINDHEDPNAFPQRRQLGWLPGTLW